MLLTPFRSDTKAIDLPSGDHCGLTFLPWSMWSSTWIDAGGQVVQGDAEVADGRAS